MHGPSLATKLVVLMLGLATSSLAGTIDSIAEARRKLDAGEGAAAVAILEASLPEAGPRKDALLEVLQEAYDSATKQAQSAGRDTEAETYRENRKILARRSKTGKGPTSASTRSNSEPPPTASMLPNPSVPSAPNSNFAGPSLLPEGPAAPPSVDTSVPPALPPPAVPTSPSIAPTMIPAEPADDELTQADAAFLSKNYLEAGRIYGKLARARQLPAERRDQWLYCRAFEVVSRINAHPKNDADWASIKAEVEQIRVMNPNNMLGEYVRDLARERQALSKKPKNPKALVVRGSAPEEPPVADRPIRAASNVKVPEASAPSKPTNAAATRIGTNVGRWQILETANFRIFHADPPLATKVAQAAEVARRDQLKTWSKPPARSGWQPACEIYLYPTAKQYAQMTGQPEDSPGFSTMGMNAGRIISRRINLRVDHPTLVQAVLPHEITHVILADHFTEQQIPRWADEGIAVLSEPLDEQQRRAADLRKPMADNRLFALDILMSMDYPDDRYWSLYYAQSVSLTRFLVEQGSPTQMIQFLQESQKEGVEPVLRRVYQIDGFADLQRRWLSYARSKGEAQGVAAGPSLVEPDLKVR